MYSRLQTYPKNKSFFLFGPRGIGKSSWVKQQFPQAIYIDLLEAEKRIRLQTNPQALEHMIPNNWSDWVILDEVQKIPELLDEVHRLIEHKGYRFVLTGSSARKLKRTSANLLAGRAITRSMHPLTSKELGADFSLEHSVRYGMLPLAYTDEDPQAYLYSYVQTYLEQEVRQEGFTRNIAAFHRFVEAASFSQGSPLNMAEIARESGVHRKTVEQYFSILEDLLIGIHLPVFTKKSKRRLLHHPKFYFFDAGVYRTIRPSGPLDQPEEIQGIALETLIFQELTALMSYSNTNGSLYYWKTADHTEVDFVYYDVAQIVAIEVKHTRTYNRRLLKGLKSFRKDYPDAKAYVVYMGSETLNIDDITILPVTDFLEQLPTIIHSSNLH